MHPAILQQLAADYVADRDTQAADRRKGRSARPVRSSRSRRRSLRSRPRIQAVLSRMWLPIAVVSLAVLTNGLGGCGHATTSARPALSRYLAAWGAGDWAAMRRQVAAPPAGFTAVNAAAFAALGVTHASFTAGPVATAASGTAASVRVTGHFDLPQAGAWNPVTTVRLVSRGGAWRVAWSPETINPSLHAGDTITVTRAWPPRAPVLGAPGPRLSANPPAAPCPRCGKRCPSGSANPDDDHSRPVATDERAASVRTARRESAHRRLAGWCP